MELLPYFARVLFAIVLFCNVFFLFKILTPEALESPWNYIWNTDATRQVEVMDYERCALLHNDLLRIGWEGRGESTDSFSALPTWWSVYGTEVATNYLIDTSPSLVEFLKRARIPTGSSHPIFYYGHSLEIPKGWYMNINIKGKPNKWERPFPTLYRHYLQGGASELYEGVIYDLKANNAIFIIDAYDRDAIFSGRLQWLDLERLLTIWHHYIAIEKFIAVPDTVAAPPQTPQGLLDAEHEWYASQVDPWFMMPYSNPILKLTLDAWNDLIEALEAKTTILFDCPPEIGIYEEDTLDAAGIPPGFAREFLAKARKPRVKYIAPGMQLVSPTTFLDQPFRNATYVYNGEIKVLKGEVFPIPLLRGDAPAAEASPKPFIYPFAYSQMEHTPYPSGLYFDSIRMHQEPWEETCRLILPFGVGEKGYARRSDGTHFGNAWSSTPGYLPPAPKASYSELYQLGMNGAVGQHPVELHRVFALWKRMVEEGWWDVGDDGISNSVEEWKKADTEEHWEKYCVHWPHEGIPQIVVETVIVTVDSQGNEIIDSAGNDTVDSADNDTVDSAGTEIINSEALPPE